MADTGSRQREKEPSAQQRQAAQQSGDGAARGREGQRASRPAAEARHQAQQAKSEAAAAADGLKQRAQHAAGEATQAAEQLGTQARESSARVADRARSEATATAARQKEWLGEELQHFGEALRTAADHLHETDDDGVARYAEMAAEQVDSSARYLRERELGGLVDDVDDFARRRPELFLGGMFLAGIGISRFLKSSRSPA